MSTCCCDDPRVVQPCGPCRCEEHDRCAPVEFVEVSGWEAESIRFTIWRREYMHVWEHMEHDWARTVDYAVEAMDRALAAHLRKDTV